MDSEAWHRFELHVFLRYLAPHFDRRGSRVSVCGVYFVQYHTALSQTTRWLAAAVTRRRISAPGGQHV